MPERPPDHAAVCCHREAERFLRKAPGALLSEVMSGIKPTHVPTLWEAPHPPRVNGERGQTEKWLPLKPQKQAYRQ